jgi:glycosyltransferase involved in cell wall biosynthesis
MTRLRVLAFGCWQQGPGYPRAPALLHDLAALTTLAVCRVPAPWPDRGLTALARAPLRWPAAAWRWCRAQRAARRELRAAIRRFAPDLLVVLHPGQLAVHVARREWAGALVLDLFLSAYDTAVVDRALLRDGSLAARLLRGLDRRACAAADLVLVDTPVQATRLPALLGSDPSRFRWLPPGEPPLDLPAAPYRPPPRGAPLELLFFGTGVPLHGLALLLDAVAAVDGVRLTLIGGSAADRARAAALPAGRLRLLPEFVDRRRLQQEILDAHLVAGLFGRSAKADSVVPLKLVHALATGRPVLTGASRAVQALLRPDVEFVGVPCGDAGAIAARLRSLRAGELDLAAVAAAGASAYEREFAPAARVRRLAANLGLPVPAAAAAVELPA